MKIVKDKVRIPGDFLEYCNANLLVEYCQMNNPELQGQFNAKLYLQGVKQYFERMKDGCEHYRNAYTIESLANPDLCHIPAQEQIKDVAKVSDLAEELVSHHSNTFDSEA